jgi:hypothetical protein
MATDHLIKHLTKTGADQTYRLHGAPDCDSAAMFVANKFGGTVERVVAIDTDALPVWFEQDIGVWAA